MKLSHINRLSALSLTAILAACGQSNNTEVFAEQNSNSPDMSAEARLIQPSLQFSSPTNSASPEFSFEGGFYGSRVFVRVSDARTSEVMFNQEGIASVRLSDIEEGDHSVSITVINEYGDSKTYIDVDTITIDRSVSQPTLAFKELTNNRSPTIQLLGDPNSVATLNLNGIPLEAVTLSEEGSATVDLENLSDETYGLTVSAVDLAGNESAISATETLTVDTQNQIPALAFSALTNDLTPPVTIVGEPGSVATLSVNNTQMVAAIEDTGSVTVELNGLSNGVHTMNVSTVDRAGNVAQMAGNQTITIDTRILDPILDFSPLVNVNNPIVIVEGEDGSNVSLIIDDVTIGNQFILNGETSFSLFDLADGEHTINAIVIDNAGNTATLSNPKIMTVDTQISTPVMTFDAATKEAQTVLVSADEGDQVTLTVDSIELVSKVASEGSVSFQLPGLKDGTHTLSAVSLDNAGNVALSATESFLIDTKTNEPGLLFDALTNISNPVIQVSGEEGGSATLSIDSVELPSQNIINGVALFTLPDQVDGTYTLSATISDLLGNQASSAEKTIKIDTFTSIPVIGFNSIENTLEPTVTVLADDDVESISLSVNGINLPFQSGLNGLVEFTLPEQSDGVHALVATATDSAGNEATSVAESMIIDTSITAPTLSFDSIVATSTPTIIVMGDEGDRVTLYVDDNEVSENTISGGSSSFVLPSQVDGTYLLTAIAIDQAGNEASIVAPKSITIDTFTEQPSISLETVTSINNQAVVVSGEEGSSISFSLNGTILGAQTIINGSATISLPVLPDGDHTVTVTTTDLLGNVSNLSTKTFTVDSSTQVPTLSFDSLGNDRTPTILVSGEEGATISLFVDGSPLAPKTIINGTVSFTLPGQVDGQHTLSAIATDTLGNTETSVNQTFVIDTTTTTPLLSFSSITSDSTPTIVVNGEEGAMAVLSSDGVALPGQIISGGAAAFTLTTLPDGVHSLAVTVTDNAGNSASSENETIMIDTSVSMPSLSFTSLTSNSTPSITVTGEEGSVVNLSVNGVSLFTQAISGGTTVFNLPEQLDGTHTLSATITDSAGNSASSVTESITIDTVATKPYLSFPALTNDNTPSITVTGEEGNSIVLNIDDFGLPAQIISSGSTTFTLPAQTDGVHTLEATSVDQLGNTASSVLHTIEIDTEITVPTLRFSESSNDNTPDVMIDGENGDSVILSVNGFNMPSQIIAGGFATFTLPIQADGTHTLSAIATDSAGNTASSATETFTVDTLISAPTLTFTANTSDNTPTVIVNGDNGDTATLNVDGSALPGQVISSGIATFTLAAQADGSHSLSASVTDSVGNTASSTTQNITIDTVTAMPTLSFTVLTADNTPDVIVSGEEGSTATLLVDGSALPTQVISGGSATFTLAALTDGSHTLAATTVDAVANSANSATETITVDTATTAPTLSFSDSTNDNTPTIIVNGETGNIAELSVDGSALPTQAFVNGSASFTLTTLADGIHTLTATATDSLGNTASSTTQNITIDTAIAVPTLTFTANTNDNTPTIIINGDNGDTAVLVVDGSTLPSQTISGGIAIFTLSTKADGVYALSATVTDSVGNSASSASENITIETAITTPNLSFSALTNDNTPTIAVSGDNGDTVVLSVDGTPLAGQVVSGGTTSFTLATLTDGVHTLIATATDSAGNTASSSLENITIDTAISVPTLSFTATTNDNTPNVTISGADGSTAILSVDGSPLSAVTLTGGTATITLPTLSEGAHILDATTTDSAGNSSSLASAETITIDSVTITPTLSFSALTNDNTPTVTIAGEEGSTATLSVDSVPLAGQVISGGVTSFTLTTLIDGVHTLSVTTMDDFGNSASSGAENITIDTVVSTPVVTIGATVSTASSAQATGADEDSTVTFIFDDIAYEDVVITNTGSASISVPSLSEGTHTLKLRATDEAGNSVISAATSFTFDTVSPSIVAISPSDSETDVPTFESIGAEFSEAMNPSTINTSSFTLLDRNGDLVPSSMLYDAPTKTAMLTPDSYMGVHRNHTAILNNTITDLSGKPLSLNTSWSFTTGDGTFGLVKNKATPVAGVWNSYTPVYGNRIVKSKNGDMVSVFITATSEIYVSRYTAGLWGDYSLIGISDGLHDEFKPFDIDIDDSGNSIIVYPSGLNVVARRFDTALEAWSAEEILGTSCCNVGSRNSSVSIDMNSNGDAVVLLANYVSGNHKPHVATYTELSNTWSPAVVIDSASTDPDVTNVDIAMNNSGEMIAIWQTGILSDPFQDRNIKRAQFDGTSWSVAEDIATEANAFGLSISFIFTAGINEQGAGFISWGNYSLNSMMSVYENNSWTAIERINTGIDFYEQVRPTIDDQGNINIVLSGSAMTNFYVADRPANGSLSSLTEITNTDFFQLLGTVTDNLTGNSMVIYDAGSLRLNYVRKIDGIWGAPVELNMGGDNKEAGIAIDQNTGHITVSSVKYEDGFAVISSRIFD